MSRNILVVTPELGAVLLESSWVMARDAAKYLIMNALDSLCALLLP